MEAPDFFVEDLLDLSNGGDDVMNDAFFDTLGVNSTESSAFTAGDSSNSSVSGADFISRGSLPDHFSGELCDPYQDLADLEWLSNFVEESFSSEDLHKFHLIQAGQQPIHPTQFPNLTRQPNQNPQSTTVPAKASRSKRSRVAPCDWSTRLLMVPAATSPATSSSDPNPTQTHQKKSTSKRRDNTGPENPNGEAIRRCLHCAAEKTPQWRTGPMGPKTLCNACGVRYKSGRLVPEYRPAASPTFVSAKHSNSHRKVVELRRQKELQQQQQHLMGHHQMQSMMMNVSNGGDDSYLIHHHLGGSDYRQMI